MIDGMSPWPEEFAQRYRDKGYWMDKDLGAILRDQAEQRPQAIALVDQYRACTYAELYHEACSLALWFHECGARPRDHVVLQSSNRIEFVSFFFAFMFLGVRPVVALPAHREQELRHFVEHSQARFLFVPPSTKDYDSLQLGKRLQQDCSSLQYVLSYAHKAPFDPESPVKLRSLGLELDDWAFFQLSGGTTGLSKLIPRSHNDYFYSIRRSAEICGLSSTTRYLAVLPVAHNFPLSSPGILGVLWAGGTCILSESSDPEHCFQLMDTENVTMTALVPPLAILWLEYARKKGHAPRSLELLQVGGARLSLEVAKQVKPILGARLQQVFGMAEGLVCYTRLDDPEELVISTQGRPMSDADEVKVVDDDDQDVEAGQPGHLLTRGPYTIRGYYRADEHNRKSFTTDGFYRTGDIVVQDSSGYLNVVGRSKDQINRGGEKIGAEEIENILLSHPAILDVAIVAIPDALLGEKSCACLQLRQSADKPRLLELNRMVSERGVASFKLPDRYLILDELPKTKVGKVNKQNLRQLACEKLGLEMNP
jgi:2,3-dihydroxybenzoate-AMP ligase